MSHILKIFPDASRVYRWRDNADVIGFVPTSKEEQPCSFARHVSERECRGTKSRFREREGVLLCLCNHVPVSSCNLTPEKLRHDIV